MRIGQPFSYGNDVSNLFTFPIFEGEKVIYTFRVAYSPDGELNGTMSTFLVDELNEYMGTTSYEEPLLFRVDGSVQYACVGNTAREIFEFEDDVPAPSAVNLAEEGEQDCYNLTTKLIFGVSYYAEENVATSAFPPVSICPCCSCFVFLLCRLPDSSNKTQEIGFEFTSAEDFILSEILNNSLEYAELYSDNCTCYALYSSSPVWVQFVILELRDICYYLKERTEKIGFRQDNGAEVPFYGIYPSGKIEYVFSPYEVHENGEYQKVEFSNAYLYFQVKSQ